MKTEEEIRAAIEGLCTACNMIKEPKLYGHLLGVIDGLNWVLGD